MRIISFIAHSADIRQLIELTGVEPEPPRISPARGSPLSPLWEGCGARCAGVSQVEPDWDLAAQAAPVYEADQRIHW